MQLVTAREFQRNIGDVQHRAKREPVGITVHGRRDMVLMSADHYDWLEATATRTHRTANVSPIVLDAVMRAEMDAADGE